MDAAQSYTMFLYRFLKGNFKRIMHRLKSKIGYKNQPITVVIGCLFLASCNFEQYIFIYNYSGSAIELAHIKYVPSTDAYAKEKEIFENLPNRSYRNYQANSFNARNLECGLEIYFKKDGGNYRYVYGGYDPKSRSCMTLQKLKYDQGYYVVIAATGVFIKGADGQWIPMIPQRERPAAALVRKTPPENQQLSPEGKFS